MKKVPFLVAGILALAAAAGAQTKQEIRIDEQRIIGYQQGAMVGAPGAEPVMAGMIGADGRLGLLEVTGKPFSGTEVRRTVQLLVGGAKIEHTDSNQIYRDDQGRTRVEQTVNGRTSTVIMDPVARAVFVLDRASKTARKTAFLPKAMNGAVSVSEGKVMIRMAMGDPGQKANAVPHLVSTELGEQAINGVMAQGTRESRTIPAGTIGNDRDLVIVDERWFSTDLQLLVKSVNTDPRFGETTYQLANIVRTMQDPALFKVPTDYTVQEDMHRLPPNPPGK